MSTRANILVKSDFHGYWLYRHCDGYPSVVAEQIEGAFKKAVAAIWEDTDYHEDEDRVFRHIRDPARAVLMIGGAYDLGSYEVTSDIHGDIEYLYEVVMTKKGWKVTVKHFKFDGGSVDDASSWDVEREFELSYERKS